MSNENEPVTRELTVSVMFPVYLPTLEGDNPEDSIVLVLPRDLYDELQYTKALFSEAQKKVREFVKDSGVDPDVWRTYDRNTPEEIGEKSDFNDRF